MIADRLKQAQESGVKEKAEYFLEKLENSLKKGYQGVVVGDYIAPHVGSYLNSIGVKYKTYTDGEFEESSLWV